VKPNKSMYREEGEGDYLRFYNFKICGEKNVLCYNSEYSRQDGGLTNQFQKYEIYIFMYRPGF
jgi:hypothetical protein